MVALADVSRCRPRQRPYWLPLRWHLRQQPPSASLGTVHGNSPAGAHATLTTVLAPGDVPRHRSRQQLCRPPHGLNHGRPPGSTVDQPAQIGRTRGMGTATHTPRSWLEPPPRLSVRHSRPLTRSVAKRLRPLPPRFPLTNRRRHRNRTMVRPFPTSRYAPPSVASIKVAALVPRNIVHGSSLPCVALDGPHHVHLGGCLHNRLGGHLGGRPHNHTMFT